VFSSWFRRQNSKKVKQGLARVRAEGQVLGRPRATVDRQTVILILETGRMR
jgi:hypothetical protein